MKNLITRLFSGAALVLCSTFVMANPPQALIEQYYQAAEGDEAQVEPVAEQLSALIEGQGADPLSLVLLGSTQTLQGRDAFLPWNKMKYVEQGLATIDKGLGLIKTNPVPVTDQAVIQGLPASYLATALAASTYTELPDMFNHFERGYDLYLSMLQEPVFEQAPFEATSWVYVYAISAAIRAEDMSQAEQWLNVMNQRAPDHMDTIKAQALISKR